ncbi:MAG TPA: hypothetical protein VFC99_21665 [Acidimicrobiia bacterium]|nr:hypothetical protein [Acidimicrobiia bacterium]
MSERREGGTRSSGRRGGASWLVMVLAALVVVLVGVVVFLILDDSGSDTATPTTTTTTVPSTTTTPPNTTPATTGGALPTTPEGYAQTLFAAWQTNNRALAAQVASPTAVNQMFSQTYPSGDTNPYTYQGCQGAAGSVICTWQGNGQVIVVTVRNLTGGLPIQVESVEFESKA